MSKKTCILFVIVIIAIFCVFVGIKIQKGNDDLQNYDNALTDQLVSDESGDSVDTEYENIPEFEGSIQGRLENNDIVVQYKEIEGIKKIDDIEFSNIKIGKINDKKCVLMADVKNLSKEFSKAKNVSIKVFDTDGEVKESFGGILTELAGLEPNKFKTYVLADITYASDIEFFEVQELD